MNSNFFILSILSVLLGVFTSFQSRNQEYVIENENVHLVVKFDGANRPFVGEVYCKKNKQALIIGSPNKGESGFMRNISVSSANVRSNGNFEYLEITAHNHKLEFVWVYKLLKSSNTYSIQLKIRNLSGQVLQVVEYPVLEQTIACNEPAARIIYWKSLSYKPLIEELANGSTFSIASQQYSSEEPNELPYWEVRHAKISLFYALAWSGGWKSEFTKTPGTIKIYTTLPANETQLKLLPMEEISGPELLVTATGEATEMGKRQVWLKDREIWASLVYTKPTPSYPLVYNSWYAVEFNLSKEFIVNQLKAMEPYKFNAFIVDAGWYQKVGAWYPHPVKFPGTTLYDALTQVKQKGILTGIWSCPQLIAAEDTTRLEAFVDKPGRKVPFMNAWLVDMAGTSFTDSLVNHVKNLRQTFNVDWWKYDQDFFAAETRQGKMKNVVAFQKAITKVRQVNPELYIENCMSGGRMVNEFTNAIAQIHWPKDVYNKGLEHAWSNFCENLGALQLMQPFMNQKWINNPEKLDTADMAVLRFYAQSCLSGTFGISADLHKITPSQKDILLQEISNYRRLNGWKGDLLYDIHYPESDKDAGFIVFYKNRSDSVAILCGRKNVGKELQQIIPVFKNIKSSGEIRKVTITLGPKEYSKISYLSVNE